MTKITLYHAEWCVHCKIFKPTWDALKDVFEKNNIDFAEFEDGKNEAIIQKAGVDGFPTIRISKDSKDEYDYMGARTADAIIHELIPNLLKVK